MVLRSWECWFSMLCMLCTNKEVLLMLSGNYVMIITMLIFIYVYIYVYMYVMCDRVIMDHDCFYANIYTYICTYVCHFLIGSWLFNANIYMFIQVCMYLFVQQIIKNCSCGRMISYANEWNEESLGYEESSGKSSHDKHMRSLSCEYEFIFYACIMTLLMLWTIYTEGYIRKMKEVWFVAC